MTEPFYFVRPASGQRLPVGERLLPNPQPAIFASPPKIGLVISTYGAAPYVALALEVRRRLYPSVPVLVHDDASPEAEALAKLCEANDAEYQTNSARLGHEMGDLSSFVGGLRWGRERGIDLLVKMSRRFVPTADWVGGLSKLALERQYGTYGNVCSRFGLPIRSECMAMHVEHWLADDVVGELTKFMLTNHVSIALEPYLFGRVQEVYAKRCLAARDWETKNVLQTPRLPYAIWDFIQPDRLQPSPQYLWHNANKPPDYAALARNLNLNYAPEAFAPYQTQILGR